MHLVLKDESSDVLHAHANIIAQCLTLKKESWIEEPGGDVL